MTNQLLVSFLGMVALSLCGCTSRGNEIVGDVIQTVGSSEGDAVAVVSKDGAGATTSFVYRVYLRAPESGIAAEVLRVDKASGLSVSWSSANHVLIHLSCGRIFVFRNFYPIVRADGELLHTVDVRLDAGGLCQQ
jgi:hypothetical protein